MTEQPGNSTDRRISNENRRTSRIEKKLNERGTVYFNNQKKVVDIVDSRAGGIGIEISQRKLKRLKLQKGNRIKIELLMPTGKYEKVEFIVKHITPIDNMGKYRIGLRYADKRRVSNAQTNIIYSNND